ESSTEKKEAPPKSEQPAREATPAPAPASPQEQPRVMPAAARLIAEHGLNATEIQPSGTGGRILKEDVLRHVGDLQKDKPKGGAETGNAAQPAESAPAAPEVLTAARQEQVVP